MFIKTKNTYSLKDLVTNVTTRERIFSADRMPSADRMRNRQRRARRATSRSCQNRQGIAGQKERGFAVNLPPRFL